MPDEFDNAQLREEWERADALRRFHAGTPRAEHGRAECIDCGGVIPEERRRIVPSAARCVDCQRAFERVSPCMR